jgi:hypothetical protein
MLISLSQDAAFWERDLIEIRGAGGAPPSEIPPRRS